MGKLFDLEASGYFYSRLQNPTCDTVAAKICALEGGSAAMLLSSGQAASFFAIFNIAGNGDHIVCSTSIYGGTYNLFAVTMKRIGISFTFIDPDCTEEELNAAFQENTKAVFGETVANPALTVLDIEKFAKAAHAHSFIKRMEKGYDTLLGEQGEVDADMVVLAVGVEGSKGAGNLAEKLRISYDHYGFYMESHVKLRPVETNTAGVYLAGVCQGPKDIPASVAQGSAAAAKVMALFSKPKLENDPQVSLVDVKRCVGCGKCIQVCPYQAIEEVDVRGQKKARVIETVCQGCGVCTATCPQGAIQVAHFTDNQLLAEVNALCQF